LSLLPLLVCGERAPACRGNRAIVRREGVMAVTVSISWLWGESSGLPELSSHRLRVDGAQVSGFSAGAERKLWLARVSRLLLAEESLADVR